MNTRNRGIRINRLWGIGSAIAFPLLGGLLLLTLLTSPLPIYADLGDQLAWVSPDYDDTYSVAWGDVDLDLAVGTYSSTNKVYRNEDGTLATTAAWVSADSSSTFSVAWGDVDGDGDLDLAVGNLGGPNRVYFNQLQSPQQAIFGSSLSSAAAVKLQSEPVSTFSGTATDLATADFYALPGIRQGTIPVSYTLYHPTSQPSGLVKAYYSLNGGGDWQEAVPTAETVVTNLAQSPFPTETLTNTHVFHWDTFASGFFGQSDNVVFRFEVLPNYAPPNGAPLFQRPYVATWSYPFRVSGTQVRVFSELPTSGNEASGALVYRQPAGHNAFAPMGIGDQPFSTDGRGYLQGHGAVEIGDQLVALLPITTTESYVLYHTSAAITTTGFADVFTVQSPGVQTLTVSADNPLIVFPLDISLEWDARNDTAYMERLADDIEIASKRLYDITDGQAMLGQVRVFHDKEQWLTAHVQISANNNMGPNADLGGSVITPTIAVLSTGEEIINGYLPGQVRMPVTWNSFGNPGGIVGEDWPNAFAHELAHYFFFVSDNYLGVDADGILLQIDCKGSVMTDAYRVEYSELLNATQWANDPQCLQTVAERATGRSDWETARLFHPFLHTGGNNEGPSQLQLQITEVVFVDPDTPVDPNEIAQVTVVDSSGAMVALPPNGVQAYQFETNGTPADLTDDQIVSLGVTVGGVLQLRGGHNGDRVCVFDSSGSTRRVGCNDHLNAGNATVVLQDTPHWQPAIEVAPVLPPEAGNGNEVDPLPLVAITVTHAVSVTGALYVQVFPMSVMTDTGLVTAPITPLIALGGDAYAVTVTLDDPVFQGYVRIWEDGTHREDVASFYFGGGWGPNRYGWGPNRYGWGPNRYGWGPNRYGWGVGRLPWNAPIMSGNGQVTLFDIDYMFGDTPPYTLQSLPAVPELAPWLTPIGEAYRVDSLETFTSTTSILFSYLQRNVPTVEVDEANHPPRIYYLPDGATTWMALDTHIDTDINQASALLVGNGTYVLAMTVFVEALNVGWNNVPYVNQTVLPVETALASLEGKYTSLYLYDESNPDTWLLYDRTVAEPFGPLVNTLTEMGTEAYWIYATEAISWYLPLDMLSEGRTVVQDNPPFPPATYYGWISPTGLVAVGQQVQATIDGHDCGLGEVVELQGQLAYKIQVKAEAVYPANGCGLEGRTIVFTIAGTELSPTPMWNNTQAWELTVTPASTPPPSFQQFLPFVVNSVAASPAELSHVEISIPAGEFHRGCVPVHNGGFPCIDNEMLLSLPLHLDFVHFFEAFWNRAQSRR